MKQRFNMSELTKEEREKENLIDEIDKPPSHIKRNLDFSSS